MEKVIDFVVEHYQLLILLAACMLDVILFLCGVFKKKNKGDAMHYVYDSLPVMISSAEKLFGSGNGSEKLAAVLKAALGTYKELTGIELSEDSLISKKIISQVELILSTPQKKGK